MLLFLYFFSSTSRYQLFTRCIVSIGSVAIISMGGVLLAAALCGRCIKGNISSLFSVAPLLSARRSRLHETATPSATLAPCSCPTPDLANVPHRYANAESHLVLIAHMLRSVK